MRALPLVAVLLAGCASQTELIRRQDLQDDIRLAENALEQGKPQFAADHWRRAWLTAQTVAPEFSRKQEVRAGALRTLELLVHAAEDAQARTDRAAVAALLPTASSLVRTFGFDEPRLARLEAFATTPAEVHAENPAPPPRPAGPAVGVARLPILAADPTRFALVVGISNYQRGLPPSRGAENDAAAFGELLEKQLGVPRRNIVSLLGSDATRSSIEAYVSEWLPKQLKRDSTLFVFFAGHGAPDPGTGDGYLVPWDADPKFIRSQGVSLKALTESLVALRVQRVLVFLDSCFSGSGGRSVLAEGTRPLVAVKAVRAPRGMSVFAAAAADEITGLAGGGEHGLFSSYLLAGLSGDADADSDGHIALSELAAFVTAHVEDDAARDNRRQRPTLSTDEPALRLR